MPRLSMLPPASSCGWCVPGGPLRGAPTVAAGSVYVISQDNQNLRAQCRDGRTQWNGTGAVELAACSAPPAPAFAQSTVVAGFSSGELTAYRYENGQVVWQDALARTGVSTIVGNLSDIDADPVVDNGRVFAVGQGGAWSRLSWSPASAPGSSTSPGISRRGWRASGCSS
jgi:outer membrane protein assembly factor BamB